MTQILAVDDEPFLLEILRAMLSPLYGVMTANDGSAALKILQANPVDLVLTDLRMNPMNGLELLRNIRKEGRTIPVILLTAYASAETASEAKSLGAFAYLTKPFTAPEVLATVQRALAESTPATADTPWFPPTSDQDPTVADVVREYMTRSHLPTPFEAKVELADELYWLSQTHTKDALLKALNDAVGWNYLQMDIIDTLLEYRKTMVRTKQAVAARASELHVDETSLMAQMAREAAEAHVRFKSNDLKASEHMCDQLRVAHGTLGPAEIHFLRDHFESSRQSAGTTARAVEASRETSPSPMAPAMPAGGGVDPSTYATQATLKLRQQPLLAVPALQRVLSEAAQILGERSSAAYKKIERVVEAHMALADLHDLYSSTALAEPANWDALAPALHQLLVALNSLPDSKAVKERMQTAIHESPDKDALAAFAVWYFRKRFGSRWVPNPS